MQTTIIGRSTNWKSLPWSQIKEKIFIIQQRLYNYSKECNYKGINKLQNYILNSSDSKIFAIEKVISQVEKYYFEYNKDSYNFCDVDKFLIYKSLFKKKVYIKSILLLENKLNSILSTYV